MTCEQILGKLESLSGCDELPDEVRQHVRTCAECERKLARARGLVRLLGKLPVPSPPPELRSRVLSAARVRPIFRRRLVQAAAAALLLIGVSSAFFRLGSPAEGYEPLDLTILPMGENGPSDEEFALEVMYGPGISIGEFEGNEGAGREKSGPANDR